MAKQANICLNFREIKIKKYYYYWKKIDSKLAVKVINNKIVIHGNYMNDEGAVEQKHI